MQGVGRVGASIGTMRGVNISILRTAVLVLGACLLLDAAPADARPPWQRYGADRGGGAMRWQSSPALERILAQTQGRMSDAERARLRRDLSATQRDRGRGGSARRDPRNVDRMTPQQREGLRRDMRDANRKLDRNPRRGGRGGTGNGDRRRDRR